MFVTNPCVQCGFCCKRGNCSYGEWDPDKKQCERLTDDNTCSLYDFIIEKEKDSRYPMFGCGCSSSMFNEDRDAKMRQIENINMSTFKAGDNLKCIFKSKDWFDLTIGGKYVATSDSFMHGNQESVEIVQNDSWEPYTVWDVSFFEKI